MFRSLAVAFGFLTRLPVPDVSGGGRTPVTDDDLRRATAWFPLVGFVVGLLGAIVLDVTWDLFGPGPAAVLGVATTVMATGAFHEDGWADTFDGLWGGWTPERRIEIMRDSRIGTYGGVALMLALALQVTVLASMPSDVLAAGSLGGAHVLGRWSILVQIRRSRAAVDQGHGAKVADPISWPAFMGATVMAFVLGELLLPGTEQHVGWLLGVWVAVLLAVEVLARIARRKIDGITGDVLGATAMASMLVVLLVEAALHRAG